MLIKLAETANISVIKVSE